MYFGRSIFQSVVERLQSESSEAAAEPMADSAPRSPRVAHDFLVDSEIADASTDASASSYGAQFYQDYELDEPIEVAEAEIDPVAVATTPAALEPHPFEQPQPEAPQQDYSYLSATSHEAVKAELGLDGLKTIDALQGRRRKFARDNHPDRVPIEWREQATMRMTAANQLIDEAIKLLSLMNRLGA